MTAADVILRKALVGSRINSAGWGTIQAGFRDLAFFSSTVVKIRRLDALRRGVVSWTRGESSASDLRQGLRQFLVESGYVPRDGEAGTIKDLTSKARLDAILKHNAATARGYVNYLDGNTPGAFAAFPCQEFLRTQRREMPRTTWGQRWKSAGGKFYQGRMIAPKGDPVWTRLSVFGHPYPPFDWGSGMGVQDISRREALALGVITEQEIKARRDELAETERRGEIPSVNDGLADAFSAGHWSEDYAKFLKDEFGDQIQHIQDQTTGNVSVRWQRCILHDMFDNPSGLDVGKGWGLGKASAKLLSECDKADPRLRKLVEGRGMSINGSLVRHTIDEGHWMADSDRRNIPVTHGDLDLVPELWRHPERVERGKDNCSLVLCLDTLDDGILKMPIHVSRNVPFGTGLFKERKTASS